MTTESSAAQDSPPARPSPIGWAGLLPYLATVSVLAGGILLQALNIYVTTSLLPSAVADIGGEAYYAWVTTAYMIASVVSAMLVSQALSRFGTRRAYLVAFAVFILGSAVATVAPAMELLLVGRVVQGLGGGLLSGLAFATIRTTLPAPQWAQGTAVVSAMFAVGTLVGPALGGAFAQFGSWRLAFGSVALVGVLLAVVAARALPRGHVSAGVEPVPLVSLLLLALTAAAISLGGVLTAGFAVAAALGFAVVLFVAFIAWERRAATTVLPQLTYRPDSTLKWVYLSLAFTTAAVATEAFAPLFGQRLIGLAPLVAGFLGATTSAGWSVSSMWSVRAGSAAARRRLRVLGPVLVAGGMLTAAALQADSSSGWRVLGWALALTIAGAGIGIAFPHNSVAAMSASDDEQQAAKAAAGIPMIGLISQSMAVAIGGVLVNLGMPSVPAAARGVFLAVGLIGVLGVFAALRATRLEATAG